MNKLFLTSSSQAVGYEKYGKILWPIVIFLGWVLNKIFYFLTNVLPFPEKGSVAVAITILTILIYMCLLPLTYRQQKFSILSKKMQPEISKIREKYQNRKDQASMVAMQEETQAVYDKYYKDEQFIRVLNKGIMPETRWVEGSNYVDINFVIDERTGRIVVCGALDNMVKGAAGQAVQNMNLIFGLPENEGLLMPPVFP